MNRTSYIYIKGGECIYMEVQDVFRLITIVISHMITVFIIDIYTAGKKKENIIESKFLSLLSNSFIYSILLGLIVGFISHADFNHTIFTAILLGIHMLLEYVDSERIYHTTLLTILIIRALL